MLRFNGVSTRQPPLLNHVILTLPQEIERLSELGVALCHAQLSEFSVVIVVSIKKYQ